MPVLCFGQLEWVESGEVSDTLKREFPRDKGKRLIKELKSGVLVVRLKTGNNKLKALERVANSPSVSNEDKGKFQMRIAEAKKETKLENEHLIQAFKEDYFFSEILYFFDTSVYLLKEKVQSGYFLNEDMEIDPNIHLGDTPFLIAFYGSSSIAANGLEGLVVMDENFQELGYPFPHFTGVRTIKKVLGKFFEKRDDLYYFKMMVQRFNRQLERGYDEKD